MNIFQKLTDEAGLNGAHLARSLGVRKQHLNSWKRGAHGMHPKYKAAMAETLRERKEIIDEVIEKLK